MSTATNALTCHRFTAMASPCTLHLPPLPQTAEAAQAIEAEVHRIEHKYSRYRDDSVLSTLNASAGKACTVDDETAWLIRYAMVAYEQSDGLFDISSGVLRQVWNFREGVCPSEQQLGAVLPRIGLRRLRLDNHTLQMPADMELDLGGLGKEYAADCAAAVARRFGLNHGIIDLGGDLHVLGPQPQDNNGEKPWMLGVRNPREPASAIAQLPVYAGGMATSGDYERYFERDGQRYCHLLNPQTGWPVCHWASATVLAPTTLLAGTLTTIAMLKQAAAADWLREQNLHCLLIRPDLTLMPFAPH
ncbi:FAD:protein FMN transferase [Thalassolituus sp. LLYu03]|uniref:FAD:protein FMN transferase n=1 Tax=Thalassolituus sp. LLYu03 TaxID=3421656 RepID=UPI003D2A5E34